MNAATIDPRDFTTITLDELHEHSTEELLALIRERRGVDDAEAERILSFTRFGDRITWQPGGLRLVRTEAAISDQCISCGHYQGLLTCASFPDRIPKAILTGEHDHSEPYPGDNGIRFEPARRSKS